jgi:fatty-acyl-CoA synthase
VIYEMSCVREVAVIGMPDERWGKKAVAVVVLAENAALDLASLATHCRSRLARFKVPRELVTRDSLPRNPSGKVLKRMLRAELGMPQ